MIALPAIDLRQGCCVQLVGGAYERERVRLDDPVAVARRWREAGFSALHVVDLDAATERGCNDDVVSRILGDRDGVSVQVGGGVRTSDRAQSLLAAGASRVVVGTRALEDRPWIEQLAADNPGRVVVAVDVRGTEPVVRGWSRTIAASLDAVLESLDDLPLAALLVTAVGVEGQLRGPDVPLVRRVVDGTAHRLIAAGGITSIDDLAALDVLGVWGAVIGMALYTGDMDAARCAAGFGGTQ